MQTRYRIIATIAIWLITTSYALSSYAAPCTPQDLLESDFFEYNGKKLEHANFLVENSKPRPTLLFRGMGDITGNYEDLIDSGQPSNYYRNPDYPTTTPIHDLYEFTSFQSGDAELSNRGFWVSTSKSMEVSWYYAKNFGRRVVFLMKPGLARESGALGAKAIDVEAVATATGTPVKFFGNQEVTYWGLIPPEEVIGYLYKEPGVSWQHTFVADFDPSDKIPNTCNQYFCGTGITWEDHVENIQSTFDAWEINAP